MRLITTFDSDSVGHRFSSFLLEKKIANRYEPFLDENRSEHYRIWVYDEDQVPDAYRWLELFEKQPNDPQFIVKPKIVPLFEKEEDKIIPIPKKPGRSEHAPLTYFLIALCGFFFIWTQLTSPQLHKIPHGIPATSISSPVYKAFLYDYPAAYEIIDQLVRIFGIQALEDPDALPSEGKYLYLKFLNTPYWKGYYDKVIQYFHHPDEGWDWNEPLFEKIREGEIWRLMSPCFLHSDIFHIFFNMIWLLILGREMEPKLGAWRLAIFMIITGVFSNTAQYFMSGPNFIGFSGVICAMLAYIWMRQRIAPWEGYKIQTATMNLMAFFILALVALQTASFFGELLFRLNFGVPIANTAHIAGAFIGFILGKRHEFAWR
jgi:GlpG protein